MNREQYGDLQDYQGMRIYETANITDMCDGDGPKRIIAMETAEYLDTIKCLADRIYNSVSVACRGGTVFSTAIHDTIDLLYQDTTIKMDHKVCVTFMLQAAQSIIRKSHDVNTAGFGELSTSELSIQKDVYYLALEFIYLARRLDSTTDQTWKDVCTEYAEEIIYCEQEFGEDSNDLPAVQSIYNSVIALVKLF
jgi:hypothetical protein